MVTYSCVFVSGGGTEYDQWIFRVVTDTDKTFAVECVEPSPVFAEFKKEERIRITAKQGRHSWPIRYGDGFVIYRRDCGKPLIFTKN